MALTRPKIWDIDTTIEYFKDPLTTLHQGATTANVDVGFIFNRANGLVSNVALYWSESTQSFITAFTANTGTTDSNVAVSNYAPLTTGNLTVQGNLTVTGTQTFQNTETVIATEYVTTINAINLYASTIGNTGATLTGTLSTAAQPNITSVGTLTALNITNVGDVSANIGGHTNSINSINANVGSYENTTNANIGTIFNNLNTLTSNVGSYEITTNANLGTVVNSINSLYTNANANTAAYISKTALPIGTTGTTYTGSTLSIATWANVAGPLVVTNNTAVQAIQVTGTSTKGGAGYHDFLLATNLGGGTNPNKSFRLDSSGNFQIINSAYTATIFQLSDTGVLGGFNQISVSGSTGTSGQVLSSTGSGLQWVASGGFLGGAVPNQTTFASNVIANSGTASTNNTTGALIAVGGAGISGNLNAGSASGTIQHQLLSGSQFAPTVGTFLAGAHTIYSGSGGNYLAMGQYPSGSNNQFGQWFQSGYPATSGAVYYPIILNPLGGNVVVGATTVTTSGNTGALVVNGGVAIAGNIYLNNTSSLAATTVLTHGSDINFQLTAQNGVASNSTGTEVARFGINYAGTGWDSFTQYIRGGNAQTGYMNFFAANTQMATIALSGLTVNSTIIGTAVNAATIGNISANHVGTGTYLTSLNASNLASGTVPLAQLSGITTTQLSGTAGITNAQLANSSLTVTAGTGMSGGGAVSLGGTVTLTNAGVTSIVAGTNISVSGATGAVTVNSTDTLATVTGRGATTSTAVTFSGGATIGTSLVPSSNVAVALGSSTAWWSTVYGTAIHAQYADLAECYTADAVYSPGTVVVFGGNAEITTTVISHDSRVAGVISTDPAYLMNTGNGLPVALTGRVPCQVQGPVSKGQVLVTSTTPGVAQAIDNRQFVPGCVVGKALEAINTNTIETIEVVVGRF